MRVKGNVAIVTGAARSIGTAIAECYAREGAMVVVNDIAHPDLLQQVVSRIAASGGEAIAVQADVSREDGAAASFGGVDILVNNAAIDPLLAGVQAVPRRGMAEDLEGMFLFLAGSESDFVTGQTFVVDGGWVMR